MNDQTNIGPNEFRCAMCKYVFDKAWSDEEAASEAAVYFPNVPLEETELVCDDCWQTIHPTRN